MATGDGAVTKGNVAHFYRKPAGSFLTDDKTEEWNGISTLY